MLAKTQGTNLRWDDVRVFLALYRERSLARAGKRVGLDASTASRRLVALEESLGARLFERTRAGLVPTVAAERIAGAAEDIERDMAGLVRAAERLEASAEGLVRMSVPPGVAEVFVAPRLLRLIEEHPGLRIELDASVPVADLALREADIALRTVRPPGGDLIMTKLAHFRSIPLASPAYTKELKGVRDFSEVRWIGWERGSAQIPEARWLAEHAPASEPVLRTNSIAAQLAAAGAGIGAVLLGEAYARAKTIVPLRLAPSLAARAAWPTGTLWLVAHRAQRRVPRVAAVWDFLVRESAAWA